MALSINTNTGAMIALQNLNDTNNMLDRTQNRVSTGLRVSSSKDDAASFKISEKMKSDVAGMEALKIGLGLGEAMVGVALDAGEEISDLLKEMKAKAVQSQGGGLSTADRAALQAEFSALRDQIGSITAAASFNGQNLVLTAGTTIAVKTALDAGNTVDLVSVSLTASGLAIDAVSVGTATGAATAQASIDTAISTLTTNLATFGSQAKQLSTMNDFTSNLIDAIETGIGALIDADLAKESSRLQSLQIKQQLGVQALGIANNAPQTILGLFG